MSDVSQAAAPTTAPTFDAVSSSSATVILDQSPVYDGRLTELLSLVATNMGLNLLTTGFYRFWAKTRLRRFFLSRISILNDRLVYTGTGMEMFIGFLVVLMVLAPILAGFMYLGAYATGKGDVAFALAQALYCGFLLFLYFIAVYRAQRYRLSRITWRGVRAGQAGSALVFSLRAMSWIVAVVLTAGFAYPLMRQDLLAYRINHGRFGQQQFRYSGPVTPLYFYWVLPWVCLLLMAGCMIWLFGVAGTTNIAQWENLPPEDRAPIYETGARLAPVFLGALALFFVAIIWYRAAEMRHFTGNSKFENLTFESRMAGWKLFLPYLAYWSLMAIMFGGVMAAIVGGMHYFALADAIDENETAAMVLGFSVLIMLLGIVSLLKPLVLHSLLVRIFCNNLTIKGRVESDRLLQNQLKAPGRGEGLADALGIDGF